jgi:hypothetical protein
VDKRDRSLDADLTRALALLLRVRAHHPPNPRELGALAGHAQPSGRARVGRPRLPRVGRPHFSVRHRLEGGRRQGAQGLPLPKLLFGSKAPGDARLLADGRTRSPAGASLQAVALEENAIAVDRLPGGAAARRTRGLASGPAPPPQQPQGAQLNLHGVPARSELGPLSGVFFSWRDCTWGFP